MNENSRFIGINQRVPIELIDKHLRLFIQTGVVVRSNIRADMAMVNEGKNRADKGAAFAWKILTHDKVALDFIRTGIGFDRYISLNHTDRMALILALIAGAYPIFVDTVTVLAKVFRVQETVSRHYVAQKIGDLYGSNRTLAVALDAIFPMLVELGIIRRERKGIYLAVCHVELSHDKVSEIFVASGIRLSGGKHISLDDFEYRDWHFFFRPKAPPYQGQSIITVKETSARHGYVEYRKT